MSKDNPFKGLDREFDTAEMAVISAMVQAAENKTAREIERNPVSKVEKKRG